MGIWQQCYLLSSVYSLCLKKWLNSLLRGYCALAGRQGFITQDNVHVCSFAPAIKCLVLTCCCQQDGGDNQSQMAFCPEGTD